MSIELRQFQPGDEDQILALFTKVFHLKRSRREWNWQYRDHCLKGRFISIAENPIEKLIIGHFAMLPIRFRVGDEVLLSALAVDLMVDTKYRVKGLFARMGDAIFTSDEFRASMNMVIALPNKNSYPGFVGKLGLIHAEDLSLLIRPLSFVGTAQKFSAKYGGWRMVRLALNIIEPLFEWLFPVQPLAAQTVKPVHRFEPSFDRLFEKATRRMARCSVYKDASYMNWRYVEASHINYKIFKVEGPEGLTGVMVLSLAAPRGVIVDLICADDQTENLLVDFAVAYFKAARLSYALTWCFPRGHLHSGLKRRGFLRAKKIPFVIRRFRYPDASIEKAAQWHLMPGDNDTF